MKTTKKTILGVLAAATLAGAAAPAFADHRGWDRHSYRNHYRAPAVYVAPRPVYAPAPAYYGSRGYYGPQSYYGNGYYADPAATTAIGAVTGALIGSQIAGRHDRAAGAAIGAILGGVIGNSLAY